MGEYLLEGVIGRGGMGVVYKARHIRLQRAVAIKTISPERRFHPNAAHQFLGEAESLAHLRHPHIVGIHEFFDADDQLFIVMEWVPGRSLAELPEGRPMDPAEAARCVQKLASAVHYAHQRGVLHRDLKPANILVDDLGEPRLTDFGLAKRLDRSMEWTLSHQILGSPPYMAPERVSDRRGAVDRASDIYSLGAVLYFLLTGRPPFTGENVEQILLQVLGTPAPPLRKWVSDIPLDLESICLKCMEKDPRHRYATSMELEEDLGRFLRAEPTLARPPGLLGRLARWSKREPALAGLGVVSVLALAAVAGSLVLAEYRVARRERMVRRAEYVADMHMARQAIEANQFGRAHDLLGRYPPNPSSSADQDIPGWEWHRLSHLCRTEELFTLGRHDSGIECLEFSADGSRIFSVDRDGGVKCWDLGTKKVVAASTYRTGGDAPIDLAVSPDGTCIAVSGERSPVRLFRSDTLRPVEPPLSDPLPGRGLWFSPEGRLLAVMHSGYLARYDLASGRQISRDSLVGGQRFAMSPDGTHLAIALGTGQLDWVRLADGLRRSLPGGGYFVGELAWSPQGDMFATSANPIRLVHLNGTEEVLTMGNRQPVLTASFSPSGQLVASAGDDQAINLWSRSGRQIRSLRGHTATIKTARFSPDGHLLASGDLQGTIKVWAANPPPQPPDQLSSKTWSRWLVVSADFGTLVDSNSPEITSFDARAMRFEDRPAPPFPKNAAIGLDFDGRQMAVEGTRGAIRIYRRDLDRFAESQTVQGEDSEIRSIAFSRDRRFAVERHTHRLELWDSRAGRFAGAVPHHPLRSSASPCFSTDGRLLAIGFPDGQVEIMDTTQLKMVHSWRAHRAGINGICFSPLGRWFVTSASDGTVRLWSGSDRRPVATLQAASQIRALAFPPDEHRLFAGTLEGDIKIWELEAFQEVGTLSSGLGGAVAYLGFLPDATTLIAVGRNGVARLPVSDR